MDGYDLLACLRFLNPGDLSYQEWVQVGMALKEAGYPASTWEDWSRGDPGRFHPGECARKWETFKGSGDPVTGGTLVQMARDRGWTPDEGRALDWDELLDLRPRSTAIDPGWIEEETIQEPEAWDPVGDLTRYLELLFQRDEKVGYVTECWTREDGRFAPKQGAYDRTAGQLLAKLATCRGDISAVIGDYNKAAGAWIRFNPLDGEGVRNANVTAWRYALVECDNIPKDKQLPLYKQLNLPIAVAVDSGNKSVHAIVRIEAGSEQEYKRRVEYLYKVLQDKGVEIDTQNKNPSRLSRMPGILRNGKKQFIIEEASGAGSWEEWREWIEAQEDDLPEFENLATTETPPLAAPLIDGILRRGHKLLLSGPSKAGKSFALLELALAIASGGSWFGWRCHRGRVLYVNFELSRESCLNRLQALEEQYGLPEEDLRSVEIWNLRGKVISLKDLVPKLLRRLRGKAMDAVILDPIYKVLGGDENAADHVTRFCNLLDRLCGELGTAVIYCHHHSKGAQGAKQAADRASGSGVFARDADALLDMIQLRVPPSMQSFCQVPDTATAWRVEAVLREFPEQGPVDLWFNYPLHYPDESGQLSTCKPDTGALTVEEMNERRQSKADKRREDVYAAFERMEAEDAHGVVPLQALVNIAGVSAETVASYFPKEEFRIIGDIYTRKDKDGNIRPTKATVERWKH